MKVDVKKETNIVELKSSFKVKYSLPGTGFDFLKFDFITGNSISRFNALEDALRFRDSDIVKSKDTNTGYKSIKVAIVNKKPHVIVNTIIKHKPYNKMFKLTKELSFKVALTKALEYYCSIKNYEMPTIINYDYGLSAAKKIGYIPHQDEEYDVSNRIKLKDTVKDHESDKVGTVIAILNDYTYILEFAEGNPRNKIVYNDTLYNNKTTQELEKIAEIDRNLKDDKFTTQEKAHMAKEMGGLELEIKDSYKSVVTNEEPNVKTIGRFIKIRRKSIPRCEKV